MHVYYVMCVCHEKGEKVETVNLMLITGICMKVCLFFMPNYVHVFIFKKEMPQFDIFPSLLIYMYLCFYHCRNQMNMLNEFL